MVKFFFISRLRQRSIVLILIIYLPLMVQASIDRLRISIISSSDWTNLKLMGNEHIINAKVVPLLGVVDYSWGSDYVSVNQSLTNAMVGYIVQVQFDILMESNDSVQVSMSSTKGDLGTISIKFYQYNSSIPVLVETINNTNTGEHPNTKNFNIDATLWLQGDLGFTQTYIPKLILAFYYPWYNLDSWKSLILRDYPLIQYNSGDSVRILHHVHLAKQVGIDGFISSWWGPNSETDRNLQKLLTISKGLDFKVSIYFETLISGLSQGRSEAEILEWLRYFFNTYSQDSSLLRMDGKPVIFIWAAEALPLETWSNIFNTLQNEGYKGVFIANTLNPTYLKVFEGLHDYGSALRTSIEADFQQAMKMTKTYGWLESNPQFKIWAATAQPGYDERNIPGRAGTVVDRANGAIYSRTFEAAINSQPDWILITTFNEWWENTHIEPSKNFGNFYLDLTAKYADQYKGFKPREPVDFFVPAISDSDRIVHLTWNKPFRQNPDAYTIFRSTEPISNISDLIPLKTGINELNYWDITPTDGRYYYTISAVFGNIESPVSEVLCVLSSGKKSHADRTKEIPIDIAIYTESTNWIAKATADYQVSLIIQKIKDKINNVEIFGADAFPDWIASHTYNGQPDIILTFGDFPNSIYPSGNQQPDRSLAEEFLDDGDGNIILNTADYIFFGNGRNGEDGLKNMMDISTVMWGDNTLVFINDSGTRFTPSLGDFTTNRPFHTDELEGTDWEVEVSFADNGANRADPVIVRNKKTKGRIGIVYQVERDNLPRAQIISEIVLNWIPTILHANPTPVELVYFKASRSGNDVELKWATASEINNSHFEIERKANYSNWIKIGMIKGSGTTSKFTEYSYIDGKLNFTKCLYRLKQVDFNGLYKYSPIEEIEFYPIFKLDQNYPNPFNLSTKISYSIPKENKVILKIFDLFGKELSTLINEEKPAGNYEIIFNAANLASGVYFFRLNAGNYVQTKKVILMK